LDFLTEQEITDLLAELGVVSRADGDSCVLLEMDGDHTTAKHCLCNAEHPCEGDSATLCADMSGDVMIDSLIQSIRKIHEGRTLMIPVGKWRSVFDVVAFSMSEDESWQEFAASATIKLNTRDPLLFESGDEHMLIGLVKSLMNNGESVEQGVFLIPVGAPILLHLQPGGPVKFWFGKFGRRTLGNSHSAE